MNKTTMKLKHSVPFTKSAPYVDFFWMKYTPIQLNFINQIIKYYFKNKKYVSLIDAGCGTGRLTYPLAHSKFIKKIIGIDISSEMIDFAKKFRFHPKIEWKNKDFMKYKHKEKVDLIISMYTSFSYILNDKDIIKTLKCFKNNLKPKGLIVLDLPNLFYYAFVTNKDKPIIKKIKKGSLELRQTIRINYDINHNIWVHKEKIEKRIKGKYKPISKEIHKLRYISVTEMQYFCKKTGLRILKILRNYFLKDQSGHRLIFLLTHEKACKPNNINF